MAPRTAAAALRQLRRLAHTYAFPPPPVAALPVDGAAATLFPVRRVFCVGRNYAAVRCSRCARFRLSLQTRLQGSGRSAPVCQAALTRGKRTQHAREMGSDPDREPPFFFCKPADAVVAATGSAFVLPFPSATANLHYEVEQARCWRGLGGQLGAH